jgi:hypothetical protein
LDHHGLAGTFAITGEDWLELASHDPDEGLFPAHGYLAGIDLLELEQGRGKLVRRRGNRTEKSEAKGQGTP